MVLMKSTKSANPQRILAIISIYIYVNTDQLAMVGKHRDTRLYSHAGRIDETMYICLGSTAGGSGLTLINSF